MASLPPQPRFSEYDSVEDWLKALATHNPKADRRVRAALGIVALLLVILMVAVTLLALLIVLLSLVSAVRWPAPLNPEDTSITAATWLGFAGSILGALLGGVAAVLVLQMTLRHERRKEKLKQRNRQLDYRTETAQEFSDFIEQSENSDSLSFSNVSFTRKRISRFLTKLGGTWEDDHDFRGIGIAITGCLSEIDRLPPLSQNQKGVIDAQLQKMWLEKEIFPAMQALADAIEHEARGGGSGPSGILATTHAIDRINELLARRESQAQRVEHDS